MRFTSQFPESLLSHMLQHRLVGIDWPWECPKLPKGLAVWVGHARRLSLLVRGATLQYYALLIEARDKLGIEKAADVVAPIFEDWWTAAREPLNQWRTSELVTVPTVASALRPGNQAIAGSSMAGSSAASRPRRPKHCCATRRPGL
jgi:hypothetical protein